MPHVIAAAAAAAACCSFSVGWARAVFTNVTFSCYVPLPPGEHEAAVSVAQVISACSRTAYFLAILTSIRALDLNCPWDCYYE
jgi:hypothetical protein